MINWLLYRKIFVSIRAIRGFKKQFLDGLAMRPNIAALITCAAHVAELVDAADSKSAIRKDVKVRFLSWAQVKRTKPRKLITYEVFSFSTGRLAVCFSFFFFSFTNNPAVYLSYNSNRNSILFASLINGWLR
jgi:hypothetical protein